MNTEQKYCEKCIIPSHSVQQWHKTDCDCSCHTEQKGWREEFDNKWKNLCCGGEYCSQTDHNEALNDLKAFIERTLQSYQEESVKKIQALQQEYKTRKRMTPFQDTLFNHAINVLDETAALIKDTKPL